MTNIKGSLRQANNASLRILTSLASFHGEYNSVGFGDTSWSIIDGLALQICQTRDRMNPINVFWSLTPGFQKKKLKMHGTRFPAQVSRHSEVRSSLVIKAINDDLPDPGFPLIQDRRSMSFAGPAFDAASKLLSILAFKHPLIGAWRVPSHAFLSCEHLRKI